MDVEKFLKQCERIMRLCEKQGFDEAQSAMCCATVIAGLLPDCEDAHNLIDAIYKMTESKKDE